MAVERFFDTNILLYGYDLDAGVKRTIAMALIDEAWHRPGLTAISVQVLQELHVNFLKCGHSQADSAILLDDFSRWPVVDNTIMLFRIGLSIQTRWKVSLWDAMILAAAQTSGARELLTEDLNHGQDYGGIRAVNPFL